MSQELDMMNQKDATYQVICGVVGKFEGKCVPTSEQRARVNDILFAMFRAGEIELRSGNPTDDKWLKDYVSGLQSNWLRKDPRLNGGVKYAPEHKGANDPAIRSMRALLNSMTDPAERAEVQSHIDARLAELAPKAEVIAEDLPEALRKFVK